MSGNFHEKQHEVILQQIDFGLIKVVLLTPEKMEQSVRTKQILMEMYKQNKIARIVIDEIQCVVDLGYDFRPAYANLYKLTKLFPNVQLCGYSASLTITTRTAIIKHLKMDQNLKFFFSSSSRSNIKYQIISKDPKTFAKQINQFITGNNFLQQTGIIYVLSVPQSIDVAAQLRNEFNLSTTTYNAKLSDEDKQQRLAQWKSGEVKVEFLLINNYLLNI